MKGMQHIVTALAVLIGTAQLHAQDIEFDPGNWPTSSWDQQRRSMLTMANMEHVDSMYTENLSTGEMELTVLRYPLARHEYFLESDAYPQLRRRIAIKQEEVVDTMYVERIDTGEMQMVVQKYIRDIPFGIYMEYHRNGKVQLLGQLAGYGTDGKLIRKGEWTEWDENEKLVKSVTYP
jgi:hypothetical protein